MRYPIRLPSQIWTLTLSVFAIGAAEFVIAGILPQVAESRGVSAGGAGNPVTVYVLAIVIGCTILPRLAGSHSTKTGVTLTMPFIGTVYSFPSVTTTCSLPISRVLTGLTLVTFYGIAMGDRIGNITTSISLFGCSRSGSVVLIATNALACSAACLAE